jgi:DNA-binding response OmpR family regulator
MLVEKAKTRVLVVDNERMIADTLALILKQNGFDASVAYSGEEAVQTAVVIQPQIVLTDIIMGKMNGFEAAMLIAEAIPDCKILLFSGQPATADLLIQARRNGHSFEVMAKPVHPDVILEQIKALVRSGLSSQNLH